MACATLKQDPATRTTRWRADVCCLSECPPPSWRFKSLSLPSDWFHQRPAGMVSGFSEPVSDFLEEFPDHTHACMHTHSRAHTSGTPLLHGLRDQHNPGSECVCKLEIWSSSLLLHRPQPGSPLQLSPLANHSGDASERESTGWNGSF